MGPPRRRHPQPPPRRRLRATYHRTGGVRHLFAALELGSDKMYGHIKKRKRRGEFLQFCHYVRGLHPPQVRIAIVCDNFGVPREVGVFDRILIFPGYWGQCGGHGDAAGALGSPAGTTPNWTSTAGTLVMRPRHRR